MLLQVNGINYLSPPLVITITTRTTFGNITTIIPINLHDGSCHHIAVARTSGVLQFYIDGYALPGTVNCAASLTTSGPLYLGYDLLDDASTNGTINEFRIWNVGLTASQVSANLRTVFPPENGTPNLIGYWRLNEPGDETIYDQSITGNHGYLGSNPYDFDAQNLIRTSNACYSGDRLSSVNFTDTRDSSSLTNASAVKIYPNPFSSETSIIVSGNDFDQSDLKIINLQGLTLYTGQITSNKAYSIGQELSNGMYFIQVTGEDKKSKIFKVIKVE
jgi:hypothetical protein